MRTTKQEIISMIQSGNKRECEFWIYIAEQLDSLRDEINSLKTIGN